MGYDLLSEQGFEAGPCLAIASGYTLSTLLIGMDCSVRLTVVLRHENWHRPTDGSSAGIGGVALGRCPRPRREIHATERGVESPFGGSERPGCDSNLVRGNLSRLSYDDGHVHRRHCGSGRQVLSADGAETWEADSPSRIGNDRTYEPMMDGGRRDLDRGVVPRSRRRLLPPGTCLNSRIACLGLPDAWVTEFLFDEDMPL